MFRRDQVKKSRFILSEVARYDNLAIQRTSVDITWRVCTEIQHYHFCGHYSNFTLEWFDLNCSDLNCSDQFTEVF